MQAPTTNPTLDHNRPYLYPPPRATAVGYREAKHQIDSKSPLIFGIPEIDLRVNPIKPPDTIAIIGRPGHGKTMVMLTLMKLWSKFIAANPSATHGSRPDIGVYFTLETTVPEFVLMYTASESGQSLSDVGRGIADLDRIESAMISALGENFVVIGESAQGQGEGGQLGKSPSLIDLLDNLNYLRQFYTIRYIFVDYLQKLPDLDGLLHSDRVTAVVRDNTNRIIQMARRLDTPFIVGIQARREVDEYGGLKFPLSSDGQHCSSIEQDFHKVLSVTNPGLYLPQGLQTELLQRDGSKKEYNICERTLGIKLLKQRYGLADSQDRWLIEIDWGGLRWQPHALRPGSEVPF